MKEVGEDGEGSLEPGVASGEEFVLRYPYRFLEFYYAANPGELPGCSSIIDMTSPEDADDAEELEATGSKRVKNERSIYFEYLTAYPDKTRIIPSGERHGQWARKFTYACSLAMHTASRH